MRKAKLNGNWQIRLVRFAAVFFLLYTVADITLPEYFCRSDAELVFSNNFDAAYDAAKDKDRADKEEKLSVSKSSSQDQDTQEQHSDDDDCFCCCTHILAASNHASPDICFDKIKTPIAKLDSLPTPFIPLPYPPPRTA